jgi:hypothetical protein
MVISVPDQILIELVAELNLYGFGPVRPLFAELIVYFGAVWREGVHGAVGMSRLLRSDCPKEWAEPNSDRILECICCRINLNALWSSPLITPVCRIVESFRGDRRARVGRAARRIAESWDRSDMAKSGAQSSDGRGFHLGSRASCRSNNRSKTPAAVLKS